MSPKKKLPSGGHQTAGANETGLDTVSVYQYNTERPVCQVARYKSKTVNMSEVLALADLCLQRYNAARARFVATGDVAAFREALAMEQDRAALLDQIGHG